jgi:hypothetical protein
VDTTKTAAKTTRMLLPLMNGVGGHGRNRRRRAGDVRLFGQGAWSAAAVPAGSRSRLINLICLPRKTEPPGIDRRFFLAIILEPVENFPYAGPFNAGVG